MYQKPTYLPKKICKYETLFLLIYPKKKFKVLMLSTLHEGFRVRIMKIILPFMEKSTWKTPIFITEISIEAQQQYITHNQTDADLLIKFQFVTHFHYFFWNFFLVLEFLEFLEFLEYFWNFWKIWKFSPSGIFKVQHVDWWTDSLLTTLNCHRRADFLFISWHAAL